MQLSAAKDDLKDVGDGRLGRDVVFVATPQTERKVAVAFHFYYLRQSCMLNNYILFIIYNIYIYIYISFCGNYKYNQFSFSIKNTCIGRKLLFQVTTELKFTTKLMHQSITYPSSGPSLPTQSPWSLMTKTRVLARPAHR
jgi:hypothetical protein